MHHEKSPESKHFRGRSVSRVVIANDQLVKAVWKEEQLQKFIFPSFERVFRALGFDKVEWWDLLRTVAFGGEIYLKGPKSIEPPSYTSETPTCTSSVIAQSSFQQKRKPRIFEGSH